MNGKQITKLAVAICSAVMSVGLLTGCGSEPTSEKILLDVDISQTSLSDEEKDAQYIKYLECVLESNIEEAYEEINNVDVKLTKTEEEMRVYVLLDLQEIFASDKAEELAGAVSTAVGDTAADHITIQDTEGNVLFAESEPILDNNQ